jgi:deazaflavin-dependent oxidoreductase (nitroreductase family)
MMVEMQSNLGFVWRMMKSLNQFVLRKYGPKFRAYSIVLLLTTIGRKSGLPRVTPLQYEEDQGLYYIGSARGVQADWYRNIQVCPEVEVQVKERRFRAVAEPVSDAERVADFFEIRLKRHPVFVGALMRLEGLPIHYTRADLEAIAAQKAMVILHPINENRVWTGEG